MSLNVVIIGKIFKDKRIKLNYNQANVAKLSGLSQGYISSIENGYIPNPTTESLISICSALNISYNEFIGNIYPNYNKNGEKNIPLEIYDLAQTINQLSFESQNAIKLITSRILDAENKKAEKD
jgi:transcriptional regulator with XRE-family HTH domain